MNFKNIFIIVVFILSGCSGKYIDTSQLESLSSKGIMDIEKDDRYVKFSTGENSKIYIISTKSNFSESDVSRINEHNKNRYKKNKYDQKIRIHSCIKLSNTKPDICSSSIDEDIYVKNSQNIILGVLFLPIHLLQDVLGLANFRAPKWTVQGFVKKTRDDELLIKISKYVDKKLYNKYLDLKNQNRLKKFFYRHDLPYTRCSSFND